MVHSASEARLGSKPSPPGGAAATPRKRRPARMAPIAPPEGQPDTAPVSCSAPQGLHGAMASPMSYDSMQLTHNDIDAIRELASSAGGAGGGRGGVLGRRMDRGAHRPVSCHTRISLTRDRWVGLSGRVVERSNALACHGFPSHGRRFKSQPHLES